MGELVGTYASPELTVELRHAAGGIEGEIHFGGARLPLRAVVGLAGLEGRFVAGGNEFAFRARLDGERLRLETDGTVYLLERQGTSTTASRAAAAGQKFRHPTGAEMVVPPGWSAQPGAAGVQLIPPEAGFGPTGPTEVYLVGAQPAPGIARADDARVVAYIDAMLGQILPGAQRTGAPEPLTDGIRLRYRARHALTGAELALVSMVRILHGMAAGVTGVADAATLERRLPSLEAVFASLAWGQGDIDPALVGVWHHWSYRSSGSIASGGMHSAETRRVMQLAADGSAALRSGTETSTTVPNASVVGQGGQGRSGAWSAGAGMIYVTWTDGTQLTAQYQISGPPGGRRVVLQVPGEAKPVEWTERQIV